MLIFNVDIGFLNKYYLSVQHLLILSIDLNLKQLIINLKLQRLKLS